MKCYLENEMSLAKGNVSDEVECSDKMKCHWLN
jgi:hypothetical protein